MNRDKDRADRLTGLVESLSAKGPEALAGVQSILREIEGTDPGFCERLRARLAQRQMVRGLSAFARQ